MNINLEKENPKLSVFIVNDLETFHKNKAFPYSVTLYNLCELTRNYNRDLTNEDRKFKKDGFVFGATNCILKNVRLACYFKTRT